MTEDVNKAYVRRYINQAKSTNREDLRVDALYRAGTHMEVIECSADGNLTPKQQQTVLDAAEKLLED